MRDIRENPFEWIVKSFTVLSATVFVASGAMNGLLFWANWRLNYFLIANPADVVMSAFVWGTLIAVASFISLIVVLVVRSRTETFDGILRFAFKISESIYGVEFYSDEFKAKHFGFADWAALFSMYTAMLVSAVILIASVQGVPFWYDTGLKVAPNTTVGSVQCGGGKVEWLGSASAVLRCGDKLTVIHKLDDLVTVQRRSEPASAAPPKKAAATAPQSTATPAPAQAAPVAPTTSPPSAPAATQITEKPAPVAPR